MRYKRPFPYIYIRVLSHVPLTRSFSLSSYSFYICVSIYIHGCVFAVNVHTSMYIICETRRDNCNDTTHRHTFIQEPRARENLRVNGTTNYNHSCGQPESFEKGIYMYVCNREREDEKGDVKAFQGIYSVTRELPTG